MKASDIAMVVGLAVACPSGAIAGLTLCNDTGAQQVVAIGYQRGEQRVSEGWWPVAPDACKTPIGWDLTHGPVYLFAKSAEGPHLENGTRFCISRSAFTIVNTDDCAAQGHESAMFGALVIEAGAKELRVDLSQLGSPEVIAETGLADVDAVFQGCHGADDAEGPVCVFHAGGVRYEVDHSTPAAIFEALNGLAPAAPLRVSGVLTAQSKAVLGDAQTREATQADQMLAQLQGPWVSADDPNEHLSITGAERSAIYDGTPAGTDYLSIQNECGDATGAGPYLQATDRAGGDVYCYAIESLTDESMSLIYLPRGNLLGYRRPE